MKWTTQIDALFEVLLSQCGKNGLGKPTKGRKEEGDTLDRGWVRVRSHYGAVEWGWGEGAVEGTPGVARRWT